MKFTWADSPDLEQLYLEVEVNPGLGIIAIQESPHEEPTLVFCSLFPEPEEQFNHPKDRRDVGIKISELKVLVDLIERTIASRPFPPESQ